MSDDVFADVAAFPLCWPDGWPRSTKRAHSQFKQTVYTATDNLREQLRLMGCTEVTLSTSIPLRRDGFPLSKPPVDGDHGAAVYFKRKGQGLCLACDQYASVEDNIQALAKTVEAMRGIERWGSTELLDRAFTGFAALPARPQWPDVLRVPRTATSAEITAAYRRLAKLSHPDAPGGSEEAMVQLNLAYHDALVHVRGELPL